MDQKEGFTLLELLVAMLVLSILVTIGIPSYNRLFMQQTLIQKSESLYYFLRLANSESIKYNKRIYVHFCQKGTTNQWKMGMTDLDSCDCFTTNSCMLDGREVVKDLTDGKKILIKNGDISFSGSQASYAPMRFSVNTGAILLTDLSDNKLKVIQSSMRLRICSPDVKAMGYPKC
jgi:type IV fimbrial biogenesis protein FimT